MDLFGLLGLLLLFFTGKRGASSARSSAPAPLPPAALPAGTTPVPPVPWPAVVPAGLPPFPGRGWESDEPPPLVVQQRAGQLVNQLWAQGSG